MEKSFKILVKTDHEVFNDLKIECTDSFDEASLIFFDDKTIRKETNDVLINSARKIAIITESPSIENIKEYLEHCEIHHILGQNGPYLKNEVARIIDKFRNGIQWGVLQYLSEDGKVIVKKVRSSTDIDQIISSALEEVNLSKFFDSPKEFIKTVSNELLTNAIYNAPVDCHGNEKYRNVPRTTKIDLAEGEEVIFSIGISYNNLFISVRDNFGRLTLPQIKKNLIRGVTEQRPEFREGGAGLGLFLVYSCCNEVVFNCNPGVSSEVIAIFEATKRYKHFRGRITSLHYYEGV